MRHQARRGRTARAWSGARGSPSLADEHIDDAEFIARMFHATEAEVPEPKPKKPRGGDTGAGRTDPGAGGGALRTPGLVRCRERLPNQRLCDATGGEAPKSERTNSSNPRKLISGV